MHIHVETAGNYAKFWLAPVSLARSVGYDASELNKIRKVVEENKSVFEEKWHEFFDN